MFPSSLKGMDITALFAAIDRKDAPGFAAFLTEDATFRMGSAPPVHGRAAVEAFVRGFFGTIEGSRHTDLRAVAAGDALFLEGTVDYCLPNGRSVAVPFLNRLRLEGGLAAEYLVYLDPTPVMAALA